MANALHMAGADLCPSRLAAAVEYAVLPGGARIRPTLCLSVAAACGDPRSDLADAAAVSLELVHSASLVHDDLPCFDDADIRRGKPTVHRAFSQQVAVLAGDSLIVLAFDVLARAAVNDSATGIAMIRALTQGTGMHGGICAGQGWESEPDIDLSAYHRAKTGALFVAATAMGALAAGQAPRPWEDVGAKLGEAFQIADDMSDVTGDAAALGKPTDQDGRHHRPNAVSRLGVHGARQRFDDLIDSAIAAIPPCGGQREFADMVRGYAQRLGVPGHRADNGVRAPGQ
nr:polyprenyl synthetase family protein [Oceaniglobus indicus]